MDRAVFFNEFRKTLNMVYGLIHETGNASRFHKGAIHGMMRAAKTFGITAEELNAIVREERLAVFGSESRPGNSNWQHRENPTWSGTPFGGEFFISNLKDPLDIPAYLRKGRAHIVSTVAPGKR